MKKRSRLISDHTIKVGSRVCFTDALASNAAEEEIVFEVTKILTDSYDRFPRVATKVVHSPPGLNVWPEGNTETWTLYDEDFCIAPSEVKEKLDPTKELRIQDLLEL